MSEIKYFKVRDCDNSAEELWWHCQCEKHNQYYRKVIFDNFTVSNFGQERRK